MTHLAFSPALARYERGNRSRRGVQHLSLAILLLTSVPTVSEGIAGACGQKTEKVQGTTGSASTVATGSGDCESVSVLAMNGNHQSLGVPLKIVLRASGGEILTTTTTDAKGLADLDICWANQRTPLQLEVTLDLGMGNFVGTVVNVKKGTDAYCVFMPDFSTDCLNWKGY